MKVLVVNIGSTSFKYRLFKMPDEAVLADSDVRDLANTSKRGNEQVRLALEVFVRSIRHYIGACLVELGGLDVLTFSGGIGENSVEIRRAVCRRLSTFDIELDENRNQTARRGATTSTSQSSCQVLVVPTNEEIAVARAATEAVQQVESRKKTEAASTT